MQGTREVKPPTSPTSSPEAQHHGELVDEALAAGNVVQCPECRVGAVPDTVVVARIGSDHRPGDPDTLLGYQVRPGGRSAILVRPREDREVAA